MCNLATSEVDRDYADTCDRDFCTCTSHSDYMTIANQRLSSSATCFENNPMFANLNNGSSDPVEEEEDESNIFNLNSGTLLPPPVLPDNTDTGDS